jgi:hypothetical protein
VEFLTEEQPSTVAAVVGEDADRSPEPGGPDRVVEGANVARNLDRDVDTEFAELGDLLPIPADDVMPRLSRRGLR